MKTSKLSRKKHNLTTGTFYVSNTNHQAWNRSSWVVVHRSKQEVRLKGHNGPAVLHITIWSHKFPGKQRSPFPQEGRKTQIKPQISVRGCPSHKHFNKKAAQVTSFFLPAWKNLPAYTSFEVRACAFPRRRSLTACNNLLLTLRHSVPKACCGPQYSTSATVSIQQQQLTSSWHWQHK